MDLARLLHRDLDVLVTRVQGWEKQEDEIKRSLLQGIYLSSAKSWAWSASSECWDIAMQNWDDQQWWQNFKMPMLAFLEIYVELTLELQCQHTKMRVPLSMEKCVAITIWKFPTPNC